MDIDEMVSNAQKNAGDNMGVFQGDIFLRNMLNISLLLINLAVAFGKVYITIKKRCNSLYCQSKDPTRNGLSCLTDPV